MIPINRCPSWLIGFILGLMPIGAISAQGLASIAYSDGGILHLLSSSGEQLKSVTTSRPIRDFGVSPDAGKVAFSAAPLSSYGGQLYLLTVSSGEIRALGRVPGVAKPIFSDPEFSPDGEQMAFAVHGSRNGDLVEASGPIAVANLKTGAIFVLRATQNIDGNGSAFANEPHWSPDSRWLVFSFETGAAIVDSKGEHLRDLTSLLEHGGSEVWSHALGWVGPGCVAYIAGATAADAAKKPIKIIRIKDGRSVPREALIAGAPVTNLVAFSPEIQVFRTPTGFETLAKSKIWRLPVASTRGVVVRLVPKVKSNEGLDACK